jgi:hypothetical protein
MATTLFEDKLSEYLAIVEKAGNGYYISNGMYHQNLEKVDVNEFIIAVKTVRKMFKVVLKVQADLSTKSDTVFGKEAFWNGLKRQKKRFESIEENQLNLISNRNNVLEITNEVHKGNQQVINHLKRAVEYNLTVLPLLFFRIFDNEEKVVYFDDLQSQIINLYHLNNSSFSSSNFNLSLEMPNDNDIKSWFTSKENKVLEQKEQQKQDLLDNKSSIEKEKQEAINEANAATEKIMAEAKKAQEDALKMMAEMQKKYGL